MGFKEYSENMSFVDMELSKTLGSSRTQRFLREIHDHINWKPIESILLEVYPVGKSAVGNTAYPPVMLLKALLLQKWFGIRSDPELENQINDRMRPLHNPARVGYLGLVGIFSHVLVPCQF